MAKILKFWHQWSWAVHGCVWLVMATGVAITYKDGVANNTKNIAEMQQQHKEENMAVRMAVQESTSKEINYNLQEIKTVQGKIFERINSLADRQNDQSRHR